eukprot:SAG25_NODE_588_length_6733_cov_7.918300_2_plen_121_part_00
MASDLRLWRVGFVLRAARCAVSSWPISAAGRPGPGPRPSRQLYESGRRVASAKTNHSDPRACWSTSAANATQSLVRVETLLASNLLSRCLLDLDRSYSLQRGCQMLKAHCIDEPPNILTL